MGTLFPLERDEETRDNCVKGRAEEQKPTLTKGEMEISEEKNSFFCISFLFILLDSVECLNKNIN